MPCYKPLTAFYSSRINKKSGKRSLVFNVDDALVPVEIPVACGRCIGCRLDRSMMWALRCVNEASLYEDNCFITLTFNEENLDKQRTLMVADFQKFMKRLRKKISPQNVRFFHCGEYGPKFSRPHHHACLFGYDFPDKVFLTEKQGNKLYASAILAELWPYGFHTIGAVTFDSAAYVARYVLKKWSEENLKGEELYKSMKILSNKEQAAIYYQGRKPEYVTMSRRPGIGTEWFKKYSTDIYPSGFALLNGKKVKPPKFYDSKYEIDNPLQFATIKGQRMTSAQVNPHNSRRRLNEREEYRKQCSKVLSRGYENGSFNVCS